MVAQQWLNNRTVYLDFAACSLHSSNQPANCNNFRLLVVIYLQWGRLRKEIVYNNINHNPIVLVILTIGLVVCVFLKHQ